MNDCDDSVVSESEHENALDGDVKEDALEIPEEFLLSKPQELDVEDELEGDFKYVLRSFHLVTSHIIDASSLQPVL